MSERTQTAEHLSTVDALRGLAALAVCCCHVFVVGGWKSITTYGWLGVYVFFVVSGFIVPYSLARGQYIFRDYPRFIAKRITRLDPPYIVSMFLAIALHYISYQFPQFQGPAPDYSLKQVLMHFGYLNSFFGGTWIIVVYWTLGIEFQYYLLVGLIYPLLTSNRLIAQAGLVALCTLGINRFDFPLHLQADQGPLIGHYAFVFLLGMLAFRFRLQMIGKRSYLIMAVLAAVMVSGICGPIVGITSLCTSLLIAFANIRSKALIWLGSISYSLYLFHYLIGGRILGIGLRLAHSVFQQYIVQVCALLACLGFAYLMCRLVEEPAKRFASRIRLHPVASNLKLATASTFEALPREAIVWSPAGTDTGLSHQKSAGAE
jgi:peptidoglycan/LPS O-acetylase OafA/YrhL